MRITRLLACRRSFFAIGALVFLAFGSLCLLIQNLWPMVAAVAAIAGLSVAGHQKAEEIQEDAEGLTARAEQPASINDPFGRCPHCKVLGSHNILRIEGTATTRTCVNCGKEWTLDHSDPTNPRKVVPQADIPGRLHNCSGCWDAALASKGTDGVACTVCGTTWKCKPGYTPPRVIAGEAAVAQMNACPGCRVAATKAKAQPDQWLECQTCGTPVRHRTIA
jgi:hypothetical protein